MKYYLLVNEGLEKTAQQEVKELFKANSTISTNVVEFEINLAVDSSNMQSARRLLTAVDIYDSENIELPSGFPWERYLTSGKKFRIEVENISGQENRLALAKNLAGKIFSILGEKNIKPELELKNPEVLVVVYFNGEKYFVGIDENVKELNARKYRVFPHSASFKGDLGYFFARKSGFKKGNKLLLGFCKDGTMAIEAAVFSNGRVYAFDESAQNTTAARKNSQLAGVKDLVLIYKISLDELDVKFSESEFDNIIFQVTNKDENKLNEIYYQTKYVLKSGGTLLLIGRESWQPSISDSFTLVSEEKVKRGSSFYKTWLLKKK